MGMGATASICLTALTLWENLYVYNYALNDMGLIMRDLMGRRSADFVSRYEQIEGSANAALQRIIDAYME